MGICDIQAFQGARTLEAGREAAARRFARRYRLEFCTAGSSVLLGAGNPSSYAQYGQNLSVSTTSRLQLGQEGWRLHLQLGQKLKRAPTDFVH